jgi:hypothetical protein
VETPYFEKTKERLSEALLFAKAGETIGYVVPSSQMKDFAVKLLIDFLEKEGTAFFVLEYANCVSLHPEGKIRFLVIRGSSCSHELRSYKYLVVDPTYEMHYGIPHVLRLPERE